MRTTRIAFWIVGVALALNLAMGARLYWMSADTAQENDPWWNIDLFVRVMEQVKHQYVDGDKVSYQALMYGALKGMLSQLDPHSEFMEPLRYDDLRHDTEGYFGGLGMVVGVRDGLLTVIEPMEGTPAFQAGILPSDQIHKIGGTSTTNFELDDAVRLLRGKPGTEVELTIKRPSNQETYVYRLTRSQIKVHKVKDLEGKQDFPLLDGLWAYVRLLQFDEKAGEDLERALVKARQQGGRGAILDLRGNPGGLLDQAVRVCELFLPENQLIVTTEGRIAEENEVYYVANQGSFQELPLVILVDHSSASASEIVSGCLQDLNRAVIVGQKTYGKGSVQKILPMPDGSALRLTTSKYYTPSHREIHNKGIWPDIVSRLTEEEEQALYVKRMPGDFEKNLEQVLASMDPSKREDFRRLVESVEDHPLEIAKDILMMHSRVTRKGSFQGGHSMVGKP